MTFSCGALSGIIISSNKGALEKARNRFSNFSHPLISTHFSLLHPLNALWREVIPVQLLKSISVIPDVKKAASANQT